MQVTIIGSGNVATVMGRVLKEKGHHIHEIYSRNFSHAQQLAEELNAVPVADLRSISNNADLFLIAVTDDALDKVAQQLSLQNKLVIHTAGSVSKEVLKKTSTDYGVVWPMKMVRKNMFALAPVTLVVDGNTEAVIEQLKQFAGIFSPAIITADDATRAKLHMLASFTLNFSNHLFRLAADYCAAENLDFSLFYPLLEESVQRLPGHHPRELQAGPAFRGDRQTIEKHLALLAAHPRAAEVYRAMTESILSISGNNHP
jgi:predicted dinucleotide-binding enzyme